jgi:hypothetical protein
VYTLLIRKSREGDYMKYITAAGKNYIKIHIKPIKRGKVTLKFEVMCLTAFVENSSFCERSISFLIL